VSARLQTGMVAGRLDGSVGERIGFLTEAGALAATVD
jgi:hypothetical protein